MNPGSSVSTVNCSERATGLGARVIGPELAVELIKAFLSAHYIGNEPGGERLARRVGKIRKMDNGESIL